MKTLYLLFVLLLTVGIFNLKAQEFDSNFGSSSWTHHDHTFYVHAFKMGATINAKYFAKNAKYRYEDWYNNKTVMLTCSGAFSETWAIGSKPVGFTIENGIIINRNIDQTMDALVLVIEGNIIAMDLDELEGGFVLQDGSVLKMDPRRNALDRYNLTQAAIEGDYTIFQTQLVYSKDKYTNFGNLYYGDKRERRFLATAFYNGSYYNIIIDVPDNLELNLSAKYTKDVLDHIGYDVQYIMNLDTGGKNIFLLREEEENLTYKASDTLDEATNLIVFYKYD